MYACMYVRMHVCMYVSMHVPTILVATGQSNANYMKSLRLRMIRLSRACPLRGTTLM